MWRSVLTTAAWFSLATPATLLGEQRISWMKQDGADGLLPQWSRQMQPNGAQRWLAVGGNNEGYVIPEGKVRWARVIPREDWSKLIAGVLLIGDLKNEPPAVEEISRLGEEPILLPMPVGLDLREKMDWKAFGVEERASAEGATWRINAGEKPAGVYGARKWRLPTVPSDGRWELVLGAKGDGELLAGVGQKRAGEYLDPRKPVNFKLRESGAELRIPVGSRPGEEVRLSLASLGKAARFEITGTRLEAGKAARVPLARGIWNWSAKVEEWSRLAPLWKEAGIDTLQLALPPDISAPVREKLGALRAMGFRIVAVEGDPAMILPGEQDKALTRLRQLCAGKGAWLDAVQYDVEPYLLPGFQLNREAWHEQWAVLFERLKKESTLPIEGVFPYWLLTSEHGRGLMLRANKAIARAVVMNYRAEPAEALAWATVWMEWSVKAGCPVSVAAECGPIPDVQGVQYRPADEGTLWMEEWPGQGVAVVLFADPVRAVRGARVFREDRSTTIPGDRTTLRGRPKLLGELATQIEALVGALRVPAKLHPEILVHEPSEEDLRALVRKD